MAPSGAMMGSPTRMLWLVLKCSAIIFKCFCSFRDLKAAVGRKQPPYVGVMIHVCRVKQGGIIYNCPQKRGNAVSLGFGGLR